MNILSLFDGISCGKVALERAGIEVNTYYASEIKKFAMQCSKNNHNGIIQVGDVTKIHYKNGILSTEKGDFSVGNIDAIIGGSPCQNFSRARAIRDGLKGDKSSLFYEWLRIFHEVKPTYFLLENVVMPKQDEEFISNLLNVKPIKINSNLVSYQNRERLYWSNIKNITIPEDKKISFQNFKDMEYDYCKQFKVNRTPSREKMWGNGNGECPNVTNREKINCLTLKQDRWKNSGLVQFEDFCRYLTTRELELAQTLPIGYTKGLTKNQAENVLGDCWTVDAVAHIFKNIRSKSF